METEFTITLQPFFIFYASRMKEPIRFVIANAPPGRPSFSVIHHESKTSIFNSSRTKDRILQISWTQRGSITEETAIFPFPICAYGNESLCVSFFWPTGESLVSKPVMITSSEQILQALAKYTQQYTILTASEKYHLFSELHGVEWKATRIFEEIEISSVDSFFSGELDRIMPWLTDRMKLVVENSELAYLWNKGYLLMCDDGVCKQVMTDWFTAWQKALQLPATLDPDSLQKIQLLNQMLPKTFTLRFKMTGKTPLAFTLCNDDFGGRHRLEVQRNVLVALANFNLEFIYNVKDCKVESLDHVLQDRDYRETCPAAEGYYEEYDGKTSWANLSISTFNQLSARNKELEDMLAAAQQTIFMKEQEISMLRSELQSLRTIRPSSTQVFIEPGFDSQTSGISVNMISSRLDDFSMSGPSRSPDLLASGSIPFFENS